MPVVAKPLRTLDLFLDRDLAKAEGIFVHKTGLNQL